MKKNVKTIIIFLIILLSITIFYSCNSDDTEVNIESINDINIKIRPKIKLLSLMKGGYYNLYSSLIRKGRSERDALNYISKGLGDKIYKEAESLKIEPKDASFRFTKDYDKPFLYVKEVEGSQVNLNKLYQDMAKSLDDGRDIEFEIIKANSDITYNQLIDETCKRSEFFTNYSKSSYNRKINIKQSAEYLNGYVIEPQGIMSFNEVIGPRTKERGFMQANIIYNGQMVPGYGGGVCQVSSTAYNAFLLAGLNIVCANRHSQLISYLPASRDAMVSTESDLIVNNPTDYNIYIVTRATGENINIAIYGKKSEYEYKLTSKIIKTIKPQPDKITVKGQNMPDEIRQALLSNDKNKLKNIAYKETRLTKSRQGIISEAYLEKYRDNQLIDKMLISHDIYYPQRGEIIRALI